MAAPLFIDHIKIRIEPELRTALAARARGQKTSLSEMVRRELRQLVKPPAPATTERQP